MSPMVLVSFLRLLFLFRYSVKARRGSYLYVYNSPEYVEVRETGGGRLEEQEENGMIMINTNDPEVDSLANNHRRVPSIPH